MCGQTTPLKAYVLLVLVHNVIRRKRDAWADYSFKIIYHWCSYITLYAGREMCGQTNKDTPAGLNYIGQWLLAD